MQQIMIKDLLFCGSSDKFINYLIVVKEKSLLAKSQLILMKFVKYNS